MDYMLLYVFPDLWNADCFPESFALDRVDGVLLREPHLVFWSDTMDLSLELIHNVVCISDTLGGGFNHSIG